MNVQDAMSELKALDATKIWLKYVEFKKENVPKEELTKMYSYAPNKILEDLITKRYVQILKAEVNDK